MYCYHSLKITKMKSLIISLTLLISINSFGFQEANKQAVKVSESKKEKAKIKSESARMRANQKIESENKNISPAVEKKQ